MGGGGLSVPRPVVALLLGSLGVVFGLAGALHLYARADDPPGAALPGVDWTALRAGVRPSIYRSARRVFDRLIAALLLAVALPLMGLIAVAVKLDSRGPILFRQVRGGELARPFTMLKFRTMQQDAPPFSEKIGEDDPRITRVGRSLRRTGLDELPQLWNVLRGDMALIGPRPEQYQLLSAYEPWQHQRHLVKPGLTGWWQVNHREARPMRFNVERDLYYIHNQSPSLDATIVLRTIRIMLSGLGRSAPGREADPIVVGAPNGMAVHPMPARTVVQPLPSGPPESQDTLVVTDG